MAGRFGPYITDGSKVFASVPKDSTPEDLTLEEALALLDAKKGKSKPTKKVSKSKTAKKKAA